MTIMYICIYIYILYIYRVFLNFSMFFDPTVKVSDTQTQPDFLRHLEGRDGFINFLAAHRILSVCDISTRWGPQDS